MAEAPLAGNVVCVADALRLSIETSVCCHRFTIGKNALPMSNMIDPQYASDVIMMS